MTPRICSVNFLNSVPYRHAAKMLPGQFAEMLPNLCAEELHRGRCELALIPIAEFFSHGGYASLPFGLWADGPVKSVLLFFRGKIEEIDTVICDASSRTSVILCRLLLLELIGEHAKRLRFVHIPAQHAVQITDRRSAVLLIGDITLTGDLPFEHRIDLSEMWRDLTGLPFIFAVWAFRPEALSENNRQEIEEIFRDGLSHRRTYALSWAQEHDFSSEAAIEYVTTAICYELNERAWSGAGEFLSRGARYGFFPPLLLDSSPSQSRYVGCRRALQSHSTASSFRLSIHELQTYASHLTLHELGQLVFQMRGDTQCEAVDHRQIRLIDGPDTKKTTLQRLPGLHHVSPIRGESFRVTVDRLRADGAEELSLELDDALEVPIDQILEDYRILSEQPELQIVGPGLDVLEALEGHFLTRSELLGNLRSIGITQLAGTRAFADARTPWDRWRKWCSTLRNRLATDLKVRCFLTPDPSLSIEEQCAQIAELRALGEAGVGLGTVVVLPHSSGATRLSGIEDAEQMLKLLALTRLGLGPNWEIEIAANTVGIELAQIAPNYGASRIARSAPELSASELENDKWDFLIRQMDTRSKRSSHVDFL